MCGFLAYLTAAAAIFGNGPGEKAIEAFKLAVRLLGDDAAACGAPIHGSPRVLRETALASPTA